MALVSFTPYDSPFYISRANFPPDNIAGSIGVLLGGGVVYLYGKYAGYLAAFAVLVMGVNILVGARLGRILLKMSLFVMAVISLSVLVSLAVPEATFVQSGVIGTVVSTSLLEVLPKVVLIVLFSLILLLSLSASIKLFRVVTLFFAKAILFVFTAPLKLFGIGVKKPGPVEDATEGIVVNEADERPSRRLETSARAETIDEYDDSEPPLPREPEFLRATRGDTPESKQKSVAVPESGEELPWLKDGPKNIIDSIDRYYDKLIFGEEREDTLPVEPVEPLTKEEIEREIEETPPEEDALEYAPVEMPELSELETGPAFVPKETKPQKPAKEPELAADYYYPETHRLDRSLEKFTADDEKREIEKTIRVIETTFESFKLEIKVSGYSRGPAITRYEIVPPEGLKLKSIVNLTDDLGVKLGTRSIRVVAPIGQQNLIGVEVPNRHRRTVVLRDIIESDAFAKSGMELPLILGMDLTGNIIMKDLAKMPHLLIAGTTGSGKSVYVNSLISGLVFKKRQDELKFIMIDPKMVELELYNGIPHLLAPVITQPEEALAALEWSIGEMDRRYKVLAEFGVRNIEDFNAQTSSINQTRMKKNEPTLETLPYIVIIIDEFANLILRSPKETEKSISTIAAMARAVGIHLVIATQRPSVDVITGIIKANFPSRIAFRVISKTDSRTILDENGAESLLDRGDMLFRTPAQSEMLRIQSPYVSNNDVMNIVSDLKRNGSPDFTIDFEEFLASSSSEVDSDNEVDFRGDSVFPDALKLAVEKGEISASFLQRKFRIGYNRASRLVEGMDSMGILAPSSGSSKPRKVLISQEDLVHYL